MRCVSEAILASRFLRLLTTDARVRVFREVQTGGRTADALIITRRFLVSIEFKLRDWKKALAQARDHQFVADFAYICMPAEYIREPVINSLKSEGVGLIRYSLQDNNAEVVVPAQRSRVQWTECKASLIAQLVTTCHA